MTIEMNILERRGRVIVHLAQDLFFFYAHYV